MTTTAETDVSKLDPVKWGACFLLLAAAVVGNSYFSETNVLIRAVVIIAMMGGAAVLAAMTAKGQTFIEFSGDARTELRKVVWPTRQETTQTTLIVFAFTVVMALMLWGIDGILVRVVNFVIGVSG